jgi:hypothetical protein
MACRIGLPIADVTVELRSLPRRLETHPSKRFLALLCVSKTDGVRSDHHAEIGDWQGLTEKPDDQIIDLAA